VDLTRRDLVKLLAIGATAGLTPRALAEAADAPERLLDFDALGNVTLLHLTDTHAMLKPVYFREPDTLLGVGAERGKPPYLTGEALLATYGIARGSPEAYALTSRAAACTHFFCSSLRLCQSLSLIHTMQLLASWPVIDMTGATS